MILIIYSSPCTWNPRIRGFAEASIGYDGSNPVQAAANYLQQIPGARLFSVSVNGTAYL